jgi:hypothetical protein
MSNEFKAGDFTSGKMGEIFKTCYMGGLAIINHKQFGNAYLIPEDEIRLMALAKLKPLDVSGYNLNHACKTVESVREFVLSLNELHGEKARDDVKVKLYTWLDVLKAI